MSLGIDELKKLFVAVIAMGNACGRAFEDKKIGLSDIKELFAFSAAARDLATVVDFDSVLPEFRDLDHSEIAQLMTIVEEHFDIPEEQVEDKIKQIFGLAAGFHNLISQAIRMVRNPEVMG